MFFSHLRKRWLNQEEKTMDNLPALMKTLIGSRTDRLPVAVFMLDTEYMAIKQIILAAIEELDIRVGVTVDGVDGIEDVIVNADKGEAKLEVIILTGGKFTTIENPAVPQLTNTRYDYHKDSTNNWEPGVPQMYAEHPTSKRPSLPNMQFNVDMIVWGKYSAGDCSSFLGAVFHVDRSKTTARGIDIKINLPPEGV